MSKIFDALRKAEAEQRPVTPMPAFTPEPVPSSEDGLLARPLPESIHRELATLRNSIELVVPRKNKVIAFAGAVRGEGTSTLASAYARFLAQEMGTRVLLVDADLTGEGERLSAGPLALAEGFLQVVENGLPAGRAVRSFEGNGPHFLPSGGHSLQTMQVFAAERTRELLRDLGVMYDVVVIDSAPVTLYPEVPVLLSQTDGVVLIVQAERTRREAAQRAMNRLTSAGCNVIGAVMNRRRNVVPGFLYRRV
jgi:Mrp family chromosome partitioning ATPase